MTDHFFIIWVLILGIYGLTKKGSPFGFLCTWMYDEEEEMRSILFEPLTECLCCMSSFWVCIYFGVIHELAINLVIFVGFFSCFALFDSVNLFYDWVAKWFYFAIVGAFIYLLPENSTDALLCMVGVFGINCQIETFRGLLISIKINNAR